MSLYKPTILIDGPVAYWRLGELTGTTAVDVQGVANGGYGGTFTLGKAGAIASDNDAAIGLPGGSFNGVTVNNAALTLGGSAITLEAWIKTSQLTFQHIIGGYNSGGSFNGYGFAITAVTTGKLGYWPGAGINWIESTSNVADGNLHHVAVTVSATQVVLYVDGVANFTNNSDHRPTSYVGNRVLGARSDGASGFNGLLDEVAIYGTALSAARIAAHYQAGIAAGLIVPPVGNCPFICGRAA
jgi:hypothetical protein